MGHPRTSKCVRDDETLSSASGSPVMGLLRKDNEVRPGKIIHMELMAGKPHSSKFNVPVCLLTTMERMNSNIFALP